MLLVVGEGGEGGGGNNSSLTPVTWYHRGEITTLVDMAYFLYNSRKLDLGKLDQDPSYQDDFPR